MTEQTTRDWRTDLEWLHDFFHEGKCREAIDRIAAYTSALEDIAATKDKILGDSAAHIRKLDAALARLLSFAEMGAEAMDELNRQREPQFSYSMLDAATLEEARALTLHERNEG